MTGSIRRCASASLPAVLALLLVPAAAVAGSFEVTLDLPLRARLSLAGGERAVIAPFVVGLKAADQERETKIDLDREFRRYLAKQLDRRTNLAVVPSPEAFRLPTSDLAKLKADAEFWTNFAAAAGADLVVTGAVDFDVEDRTGYRREEYVSPIDGRTYYRQVLVSETGYGFDIVLLVLDGKTGAVLLEESFQDFQTREGNRRDELGGLFDNLFALENRLLGIFTSRRAPARRFIFDD